MTLDVVAGARRTGPSVSRTASGIFTRSPPTRGLTKGGGQKCPSSAHCVEENASLMSGVRGHRWQTG